MILQALDTSKKTACTKSLGVGIHICASQRRPQLAQLPMETAGSGCNGRAGPRAQNLGCESPACRNRTKTRSNNGKQENRFSRRVDISFGLVSSMDVYTNTRDWRQHQQRTFYMTPPTYLSTAIGQTWKLYLTSHDWRRSRKRTRSSQTNCLLQDDMTSPGVWFVSTCDQPILPPTMSLQDIYSLRFCIIPTYSSMAQSLKMPCCASGRCPSRRKTCSC